MFSKRSIKDGISPNMIKITLKIKCSSPLRPLMRCALSYSQMMTYHFLTVSCTSFLDMYFFPNDFNSIYLPRYSSIKYFFAFISFFYQVLKASCQTYRYLTNVCKLNCPYDYLSTRRVCDFFNNSSCKNWTSSTTQALSLQK